MDLNQIILMLTPVIVWAATQLVKLVKPKISGWVLTGLVVPLLSIAITIIAQYVGVGGDFIVQVVVGLLAVFLQELFKQFNQGNDQSKTAIRNQ
ncbi:MAG: hypothetical protein IPL84_03875 [Chitinophagaceae bacterium]|nr:hypothetical protein [Chitinophagaceae bacterium]